LPASGPVAVVLLAAVDVADVSGALVSELERARMVADVELLPAVPTLAPPLPLPVPCAAAVAAAECSAIAAATVSDVATVAVGTAVPVGCCGPTHVATDGKRNASSVAAAAETCGGTAGGTPACDSADDTDGIGDCPRLPGRAMLLVPAPLDADADTDVDADAVAVAVTGPAEDGTLPLAAPLPVVTLYCSLHVVHMRAAPACAGAAVLAAVGAATAVGRMAFDSAAVLLDIIVDRRRTRPGGCAIDRNAGGTGR